MWKFVINPELRRAARWLAPLLLALVSPTVCAQGFPIDIEADRAEVSQKTGVSTYTGNVVLTRGPLRLSGSRLTVSRSDDGEIRAELEGEPVQIRRDPDDDEDGAAITGRANRLTYRAAEAVLELNGNAVLNRDGDAVRGDRIRHFLDGGRTEAMRGDDERVRITIQPETAAGAGVEGEDTSEPTADDADGTDTPDGG
ncbi:MAG: lipopolysaccharide transport periplasmic protein LptA [Salinisphaeraceae bacterium]